MAICLKAMATQPKDRYLSARELADDVQHWLADEAVTAHRDSFLVRMGRWAPRHKASVAAAIMVVVTGITILDRRGAARSDAAAS